MNLQSEHLPRCPFHNRCTIATDGLQRHNRGRNGAQLMSEEPQKSDGTELGPVLRRLRDEAGLSLYELEKRSGISRSTLLRMENGQLPRPTTNHLNKVARGLGVEPEVLYDAIWESTKTPLPSSAVYFRSKYRLSAEQIAELEDRLQAMTEEQPNEPTSDQSEEGGQP